MDWQGERDYRVAVNEELKAECIELLRVRPESWDEGPEELFASCLIYLDSLRESGDTNMFGAVPYLTRAMEISDPAARKILSYWMIHSVSERQDES